MPTAESILRRIAIALGHPKDRPITLGDVDSLTDVWVRAMAMIARHVGADPIDPMGVAQAVEDRIEGRLVAPAIPASTPVRPDVGAPPSPAEAARAFIREGHIYVEVGGLCMRVRQLDVGAVP